MSSYAFIQYPANKMYICRCSSQIPPNSLVDDLNFFWLMACIFLVEDLRFLGRWPAFLVDDFQFLVDDLHCFGWWLAFFEWWLAFFWLKSYSFWSMTCHLWFMTCIFFWSMSCNFLCRWLAVFWSMTSSIWSKTCLFSRWLAIYLY